MVKLDVVFLTIYTGQQGSFISEVTNMSNIRERQNIKEQITSLKNPTSVGFEFEKSN